MAEKGRYLRYAEEVGEGEEPNPHFQGYFVLKTKMRMTQLLTWAQANGAEEVNFDIMKGDIGQNDTYVEKEGGPIHEHGDPAGIRGREKKARTAKWRDQIKSGVDVIDLIDTESGALLHLRQLRMYQSEIRRRAIPAWRDVVTTVIFGPPGSGKTRYCMDVCPDAHLQHMNNAEWWPGYNGQPSVVMDDFAAQYPITRMLNLLDGYKLNLPIKGGFEPAAFTQVMITSNINPTDWYVPQAGHLHLAALARRIDHVLEIADCGCVLFHKGPRNPDVPDADQKQPGDRVPGSGREADPPCDIHVFYHDRLNARPGAINLDADDRPM